MSWIQRFFGRQSWEDQYARNIYGALVEEGGPGADRFSATDLGIRVGDLEKFSNKERLRLEMFCFAILNSVAVKSGENFQKVGFAFGSFLNKKWKERGIHSLSDKYDMAQMLFDDYEKFLEAPVKWCGEWLSEFYETDEEVKSNRILFTDHCLKQVQAMRVTLEEFI